MLITSKTLEQFNACIEGIEFFKKANFEGLNSDKLHLIKGDLNDYFSWLRNKFFSSYEYNDQGLIIKVIDSNGYWNTNEYNDQGLLTKFTNSYDYWDTNEYNDQGLLTKFTNSYGSWKTYEYNNQGLIIKVTKSEGDCKTNEYEFLNNRLHKMWKDDDLILTVPIEVFE